MDIKDKVAKMNSMILKGKRGKDLDKFYDKNATKQENDEPPVPRTKVNAYATKFFNSVKSVKNNLLASLTGKDISTNEWEIKYEFKDGKSSTVNQIAVQRWNKGKIIRERFYHK